MGERGIEELRQRLVIAENNELAALRALVPRLLRELSENENTIEALRAQLEEQEHGGS